MFFIVFFIIDHHDDYFSLDYVYPLNKTCLSLFIYTQSSVWPDFNIRRESFPISEASGDFFYTLAGKNVKSFDYSITLCSP